MHTYTEDQLAEIVARSMKDHSIEPTDDYTAAAGADYGYVAAWQMPRLFGERGACYAVQYGNNADTDYQLIDNIDDLSDWLVPDDRDDDWPVVLANVRGIDAVEEALADCENFCRVLVSHAYYGPTAVTSWVEDDAGRPLEFGSAALAREWLDDAEDGIYHLSHNESGRPTYRIVAS